jgi:hypothetical protein
MSTWHCGQSITGIEKITSFQKELGDKAQVVLTLFVSSIMCEKYNNFRIRLRYGRTVLTVTQDLLHLALFNKDSVTQNLLHLALFNKDRPFQTGLVSGTQSSPANNANNSALIQTRLCTGTFFYYSTTDSISWFYACELQLTRLWPIIILIYLSSGRNPK